MWDRTSIGIRALIHTLTSHRNHHAHASTREPTEEAAAAAEGEEAAAEEEKELTPEEKQRNEIKAEIKVRCWWLCVGNAFVCVGMVCCSFAARSPGPSNPTNRSFPTPHHRPTTHNPQYIRSWRRRWRRSGTS